MRYSMELIGENDLNLAKGDVNGDGTVDALDALQIMRQSMELR